MLQEREIHNGMFMKKESKKCIYLRLRDYVSMELQTLIVCI